MEVGVSEPVARGGASRRGGFRARRARPTAGCGCTTPQERVPEVARVLVGAGLDITELTQAREDLEAHFLRLTGGAP